MRKSKFKLTHLHSTTLDPGYLVPFLLVPTLPNDTFRIGLSSFVRAQPMLAPLMHEVYIVTQYWFVPNRLVWDDWEEFITGGQDLMSTPPFPYLTLSADDAKVGSLSDYFGFPTVEGIEVSALPYRAYNLIWNERYRDEDLQQPLMIDYGSGEDTNTARNLLSPSFSKDYFTTARPFTQRGNDVIVPVYEAQGGLGGVSVRALNYHVLVLVMNPSGENDNEYVFGTHTAGTVFGQITPDGLTPDQLTSAVQTWIKANVGNWDALASALPDPVGFTPAFLDPRLAATFNITATYYEPNPDGVTEGTYTSRQVEVRVFVLPYNSDDVSSDTPVVEGFAEYGFQTRVAFETPTSDRPTNFRTMIFTNSYGTFAMVNLWNPVPAGSNTTYSFAGNPWLNAYTGTYNTVSAASS